MILQPEGTPQAPNHFSTSTIEKRSGIVMLSMKQLAKASSSMIMTLSGIVTLVREQLANALFPIY